MSKAILVIDMYKTCADCPICAWNEETGLYNCLNGTKEEKCVDEYLLDDRLNKPSWCPLKPLPQKRILPKEMVDETNYGEEPWFSDGYNACIDEILGEKIDE